MYLSLYIAFLLETLMIENSSQNIVTSELIYGFKRIFFFTEQINVENNFRNREVIDGTISPAIIILR
jgi:hypothetical protein